MIKLIDRENHALLAAITGREQAAELKLRIAELLDGGADDPQDGGGV